MVRTSVPALKPPDPETACPTEMGRVRIVESKGAITSVLRNRSMINSKDFSLKASSFLARSNLVRLSSKSSWEISLPSKSC